MMEVWKEIEGFEGKYRVSNTGKIFSLKYGFRWRYKDAI